jgi:hypothetical protein
LLLTVAIFAAVGGVVVGFWPVRETVPVVDIEVSCGAPFSPAGFDGSSIIERVADETLSVFCHRVLSERWGVITALWVGAGLLALLAFIGHLVQSYREARGSRPPAPRPRPPPQPPLVNRAAPTLEWHRWLPLAVAVAAGVLLVALGGAIGLVVVAVAFVGYVGYSYLEGRSGRQPLLDRVGPLRLAGVAGLVAVGIAVLIAARDDGDGASGRVGFADPTTTLDAEARRHELCVDEAIERYDAVAGASDDPKALAAGMEGIDVFDCPQDFVREWDEAYQIAAREVEIADECDGLLNRLADVITHDCEEQTEAIADELHVQICRMLDVGNRYLRNFTWTC